MTDDPTQPITLADLRARREEILALAEKHGASNVRVFGSVARGEATAESDVDLLVTFRQGASLMNLSGLWQDLQVLLERDINVISEGGLRDHFKQRIQKDIIVL